MKQRLFIAINLPEATKKQLVNIQPRWPELPVRWIKPENLHITLVFLSYISNDDLLKVLETIKGVVLKHSSFSINLTKICYGPPKKMPPRLVWVEGKKSEELGKLQKELENSLFSVSIKGAGEPENRSYIPHITLGRIRALEFRQIEPEDRPEINEEISLSFEVNSIEVMESNLKHGGAEYTILESVPLKV
jgi:2'-5' RNA ligase